MQADKNKLASDLNQAYCAIGELSALIDKLSGGDFIKSLMMEDKQDRSVNIQLGILD